jgi:light-independent protochlorophyllide reductase subunit B
VAGLGTYSREFGREVREAAASHGVEPLISDDYLAVEAEITKLAPDLVLGTQMERHIAKRLRLPCAVISSPAHVQDYPARCSPQMGFEGANVIFDTWVHPLMMGLEEHLLSMFRGDFEFHDAAPASHLGTAAAAPAAAMLDVSATLEWTTDATQELSKIPFFVRGRARRNTERFALERRLEIITLETLYDAKAHYSR